MGSEEVGLFSLTKRPQLTFLKTEIGWLFSHVPSWGEEAGFYILVLTSHEVQTVGGREP